MILDFVRRPNFQDIKKLGRFMKVEDVEGTRRKARPSLKVGLLISVLRLSGLELLDHGLEERRGKEAGELTVRGGVGNGQGSRVGVDGGLIQG
jgi:hypothetical protein